MECVRDPRSHPCKTISCGVHYMQMRCSDADSPTTTPTGRASMIPGLPSPPLTRLLCLTMRRIAYRHWSSEQHRRYHTADRPLYTESVISRDFYDCNAYCPRTYGPCAALSATHPCRAPQYARGYDTRQQPAPCRRGSRALVLDAGRVGSACPTAEKISGRMH